MRRKKLEVYEKRVSNNIKTTLILKRLQAYTLAKESDENFKDCDMTRGQVAAANILLNKTLPNVAMITIDKAETTDDPHAFSSEALDRLIFERINRLPAIQEEGSNKPDRVREVH